MNALQGASTAIGFLQQSGICCDSFTLLRKAVPEALDGTDCVELCRVPIALLEELRLSLRIWCDQSFNYDVLEDCWSIALKILKIVFGTLTLEPSRSNAMLEDDIRLHVIALSIQIVAMSILSYTQAHSGHIKPDFLVDPLLEIHLLGNGKLHPQVVVKMLDFTCLRGMIQDNVVVFCPTAVREDMTQKNQPSYDLLASPVDFADTWGPARFVTDTTAASSSLYAIEVGGGTVYYAELTKKLHWSSGLRPYASFTVTFSSGKKILIGGATINYNCPLDEDQSWRHPATNAYIRNLGTYQASWELQQAQVGLQVC
jgi:hypothetical protein